MEQVEWAPAGPSSREYGRTIVVPTTRGRASWHNLWLETAAKRKIKRLAHRHRGFGNGIGGASARRRRRGVLVGGVGIEGVGGGMTGGVLAVIAGRRLRR